MAAVAAGFAVADVADMTLVRTVVGSAEGLAIGAVSKLVWTKESKSLMRAVSRLWIHFPQA